MEALSLVALSVTVILAGITAVGLVRVLRQTRRQAAQQATRARRQERLADLGRCVLAGTPAAGLRRRALESLQAGLGVSRTAIFEPRGEVLVPVADAGWPGGPPELPAGPASQAGASLAGEQVVVCEGDARPSRFPGDAALGAAGVRGGVTVPVRSRRAVAGVLAAFDDDGRRWAAADIHYVESLAGLLGAGLGLREEERALRASEEMRRSITESSPDYIMMVDRKGTILYINRTVPGLTVEEVLGMPVYDYVPEEARPVLADCYRRVFETGRPDGYSVAYPGENGTLHFECRVGPVMTDGRVEALIINASDVTGRVRADEKRAQLEAKLRQSQKLEAVGTLAGGVAHDFNNLLTAIQGSADLALECLEDGHPARRPLKLIRKVTDQAVSVTRSLLTFSRGTEARRQPENLREIVAESMGLLRRLLPAAIDIRQEVAPDPVWVEADRDQIQQMLMNLALNARDAMPDGGRLTVSLAPAGDDDEALLRIADGGTGMPPDVAARIFEPFFTTKPRGKGTGLGLAVVHGIVQEHRGRIEVMSRPGEGTTFTVRLPRTRPPTGAVAEPGPEAPAGAAVDGPVLLAEDNEDVRSVLLAGLERAGVDVIPASDGDQALARFGERVEEIRAVVLDIDLPRRSGLACLDAIRERRPELPAVLITGDPARMARRPLRPHERLLAKPFAAETLVERLAELLDDDDPAGRETGAPRRHGGPRER